jgi:hypothetical protein
MKVIKQLAVISVVIFLASVCAAATAEIPAKYNLDKQLEKVSQISDYNFMDWDKIDKQSFILQTSPNTFYLIVLSSPSDKLLFTETIKISSNNNMVKPGYNNVIARGAGFSETYIINKIYRIKDSKQVKEIKAQLTGEKK